MGHKCAVSSCDSVSDEKTKETVYFYEFPSTPSRKQKWLEFIGRPYFKPPRSARVCSKHFDEKYLVRTECQVLKKDAVPFSLKSPSKSPHRRTLDSFSCSDKDNNQQDISVMKEPPIGPRPRRNTVFKGTYDFGRRHRVAAIASKSLSSIQEPSAKKSETAVQGKGHVASCIGKNNNLDSETDVASDAERSNSASKSPLQIPLLSKSPLIVKKHLARANQSALNANTGSDGNVSRVEAATMPPFSGLRTRRATVFKGTYDFGKRPKSQKQSITEQQIAEKSPVANQRQGNAVSQVIGTNDFGKRTNSDNQLSRPLKISKVTFPSHTNNQPLPVEQSFKEPAVTIIQRPSNAAVITVNGFAVQPASANYNKQPTRVSKTLNPSIRMTQLSIDKYFGTKTTSVSQTASAEPRMSRREDCIFGWSLIGSHAVPYIVQDSEKFCSVRILEKSVLAKYKKRTPKIGPCHANIQYFPLTAVQCDLLHEINKNHCDYAYGKERFTMKDKLVRLRDARKYFIFVDLCHQPLTNRIQSEGLEFGFTLVNKTSFIPYTILNQRKFIPLSYVHFDDETFDLLKGMAAILPEDDALFLKFCCKFDGISDVDGSIEVIELREIQNLAPPKTTFSDCWPSADKINCDLRVFTTTKGIRFQSVERNKLK